MAILFATARPCPALVLCALIVPASAAAQQPRADAAALAGVWGADTTFGPAVRGELTIRRRGAAWRARLGRFEVSAAEKGDSVRFELPAQQGGFRGRVEAAGARIAGFWIQPGGVEANMHYATPVTLRRVGPGIWRGAVSPREDRYQLYAVIRPDSAGAVTAFFRNPQRNERGGARRFVVERTGNTVRFVPPGNAAPIAARLHAGGTRLVVTWPARRLDLSLRRMRREEAGGLFPRASPHAPYRYRPPAVRADGWRTAHARSVGMDAAALERLVRLIEAADPADAMAAQVHSIVVARRGRLVLEEYFHGHDADRPHDLRSASKTFTGVLLGAWRHGGLRLGPQSPVVPLFAAPGAPRDPDPRKNAITVGHLLSMTSGLACDENDEASPGNENTMQTQTAQPDWNRFALDLPMAAAPGERYAYCSAGMNLAGGALGAAGGEWLPSAFHRLVAAPMGITRYHANLTPTGEMYFGGGMRMVPRDFLKFGQLYLDGGTWNGRRIVSAEWVAESTRRQTPPGPGGGDGWGWHLNEIRAGGRVFREYEANGNGGQLLMVLPELELAVVITAGNYNSYGVWRKFRDEWLPEHIIPAAGAR
jgi:CubicO group peptidase (beta-lactamase class C family)